MRTVVTSDDVTHFWQSTNSGCGVGRADQRRRNAQGIPTTTQGRLRTKGPGQKYTVVLRAHYVVNGQSVLSESTPSTRRRGTVRAVRDLSIGSTDAGEPGYAE